MKSILIMFLFISVLVIGCQGTEKERKHIKSYKLVNLNDKLTTNEKSSGAFFLFMGAYSSNTETILEYMFMYKDEYGCIAFKKLNADNKGWDEVYLIERNIDEPLYIVKTYNKCSITFHYLIVPKGTIASSNDYKINLK